MDSNLTAEKIAELKRLWAAASTGPWSKRKTKDGTFATTLQCGASAHFLNERDAGFFVAIHNAFPDIIAALEANEKEISNLQAEVEELEYGHEEYEKDCKKALVSLATTFNYEWDGDGATADDLREFIEETVREAKRVAGMKDKDCARMKAEGAAEWLENAAREGGYYERSSEGMMTEAAELRRKAGE